MLPESKRALPPVTAAAVTAAAVASLSSGTVFAAPIMASVAYVATPVPRLVGVEIVVRLFPACRVWSPVAVTRIEVVVDMAIKPTRAMEPGAGPDEQPANKPIRPIVAISCAIIWSIVIIAIRAHRRRPDVDGYLRRRARKATQHGRREKKKPKRS
jgi:hypothetical protein